MDLLDLRIQLEEAQEKIRFLEEAVQSLVVYSSDIPEGLEYLFVED